MTSLPSSALPSLNPPGGPCGVFLMEPAKKMTEYWVFQDKSFKRACIHRSNCSVRQGTLKSLATFRVRELHGAFPTWFEFRTPHSGG